jgi:hypothetical protein
MDHARVTLKYQLRQRISAALGGITIVFFGTIVLSWVIHRALFSAQPALMAVVLSVAGIGAFEILRLGWSHFALSAASPRLLVDNDRVVIDDTRVMTGMQSISLDRIYTVYVGPGVGDWLVDAYSEDSELEQTQLARYPQLPNALVVLDEPVYMTRAKNRLMRLWHLSSPPSPKRPTSSLWLTTEEADSFTLLMNNKGIDTHWVPNGASFPGPSILDARGWL